MIFQLYLTHKTSVTIYPQTAGRFFNTLVKAEYQAAQLQQFYNHYYSSDAKGYHRE